MQGALEYVANTQDLNKSVLSDHFDQYATDREAPFNRSEKQ